MFIMSMILKKKKYVAFLVDIYFYCDWEEMCNHFLWVISFLFFDWYNIALFDNISFVWAWELHYHQSELKDVEIPVQQNNSSQRFTVSFVVLKLSFSYRIAIKFMSLVLK
jgi:hypothetical protein